MTEVFEKQCNKCFEVKPSTQFYKASGRARAYGDGLMKRCKSCQDSATRQWQKEHPERSRAHASKANKVFREKVKSGEHETDGKRYSLLGLRVNAVERGYARSLAQLWGCTESDVIRRLIREEAIKLGIIANTKDGSIVWLDTKVS